MALTNAQKLVLATRQYITNATIDEPDFQDTWLILDQVRQAKQLLEAAERILITELAIEKAKQK